MQDGHAQSRNDAPQEEAYAAANYAQDGSCAGHGLCSGRVPLVEDHGQKAACQHSQPEGAYRCYKHEPGGHAGQSGSPDAVRPVNGGGAKIELRRWNCPFLLRVSCYGSGWGLHGGYTNLGCTALAAKRNSIGDRCAAFWARMFHWISSYRSGVNCRNVAASRGRGRPRHTGLNHTGLNRVFLASGLNVYQGEIRAFALRLNGDDVLVGLGADFQFYRAAVIALVAAQGL